LEAERRVEAATHEWWRRWLNEPSTGVFAYKCLNYIYICYMYIIYMYICNMYTKHEWWRGWVNEPSTGLEGGSRGGGRKAEQTIGGIQGGRKERAVDGGWSLLHARTHARTLIAQSTHARTHTRTRAHARSEKECEPECRRKASLSAGVRRAEEASSAGMSQQQSSLIHPLDTMITQSSIIHHPSVGI
jgi:hypothetical protein